MQKIKIIDVEVIKPNLYGQIHYKLTFVSEVFAFHLKPRKKVPFLELLEYFG